MKAVIMAAGRGTRLLPLTKHIPKCMVKLAGKPIIGWVYDILEQVGINEVYIVAGYKKDIIWNFIKRRYSSAHMVVQKELKGTTDALRCVDEKYLGDDFLVLAADSIYSYDDIVELMKKPNSLLYTKHTKELYSLGTMEMDGDKIIHIHEKCTNPVSNIVNISAYHFTKDIYNYLDDTPFHPEYKEQIITETINRMIDDNHVFTGIEASTWYHVTYEKDLDKIERRLIWKRRE